LNKGDFLHLLTVRILDGQDKYSEKKSIIMV